MSNFIKIKKQFFKDLSYYFEQSIDILCDIGKILFVLGIACYLVMTFAMGNIVLYFQLLEMIAGMK